MPSSKNIFTVDSDYYSASLFDQDQKEPFIPIEIIKQFIILLLALIALFFAYRYISTNLQTITEAISKMIPQESISIETNKEGEFFRPVKSEKIEKILKPNMIKAEEQTVEKASVSHKESSQGKENKEFYLVDEYIEAINKIIRE